MVRFQYKGPAIWAMSLAIIGFSPTYSQAAVVSISSSVFGQTATISADTIRYAGSINSLTYRGLQYIDSHDHGRGWESASSFDNYGECFNPTEAGTLADGNGLTSSSVSLTATNTSNVLQTSTNPAFWLAPGANYGGPCGGSTVTTAQNTTVLSGHTFSKTVAFGYLGVPNLISYDVNFHVTEAHTSATFEAVTAYLPPTFSQFMSYDATNKRLFKLSPTTAGQNSTLPVIVATADGLNSMGVMSPSISPSSPWWIYFGYAYLPGNTSKWNCVFGETSISAGSDHGYSCPVAIGTVDETIAAMNTFSGTTNTSVPIYRFVMGVNHFWSNLYSEGAQSGWTFEGTSFKVFPSSAAGYVPLYRCRRTNGVDHFASVASNCEGFTQEGTFGYVSSAAGTGLTELYRFRQPSIGQHLMTTNYNEGVVAGYTYEGVLGYVPTP